MGYETTMEGFADPESGFVEQPDQAEWLDQLAKLREPFPPDRIEKLPKPMWKAAWDDAQKSHCDICGGYHPLANTIHLDYVGHASTTDRLLEVDPCWTWEPMAYTEAGTPLFSDGGLWIKLTVLGVTRIGYGDGKSVKEVIGDAIRNAAMRFGVALDLWSKVDLHEGLNPDTPSRRNAEGAGVRGTRGGGDTQKQRDVAADAAPNQEALDALGSACDKHGFDRRSCGRMFREWADQQDPVIREGLSEAPADAVYGFTEFLIVMATTEPDAGSDGGNRDAADVAAEPAADVGAEPAAGDKDIF